MYDGMTHFQHTLQIEQRLIIDFVFSQQLGVISKVAQEPAQFPHRSGRAVQAACNQTSGQMPGLENCEANRVIRFLRMPTILHSIDPGEKQSIRNGVDSRSIRGTEVVKVASQAAPSLAVP